MADSESGDSIVTLRGGLTARLAPYQLMLRLEAADLRLTLDGDGHLWVEPIERLSASDADLLRRYRDDVTRLLRYVTDDSHLVSQPAAAHRVGRRHLRAS